MTLLASLFRATGCPLRHRPWHTGRDRHDFRTPITSLRLQAALIDDETPRGDMVETLADMRAMVEETLDFASDDAAREATQAIDLQALLRAMAGLLPRRGRPAGRAGTATGAGSDTPDLSRTPGGAATGRRQPDRQRAASRGRRQGVRVDGLPIARTCIQAHGGDVVLANRPEGGLRASIHLPA
ncbi:MAG TPA: hypothetical protein VMR43_01840 [Variovorax sp.]|nr:hypothetical protein [Variovorax sp.]